MPIWSDADTIEVLLAVLDETWTSPPSWDKVEAKMKARGRAYTASAIRQRVQKLRKDYRSTRPSSSATSTPMKLAMQKKNTASIKDAFPSNKSPNDCIVTKKRTIIEVEDGDRMVGQEDGDVVMVRSVKKEPAEWHRRVKIRTEAMDEFGTVLLDADDDLYE